MTSLEVVRHEQAFDALPVAGLDGRATRLTWVSKIRPGVCPVDHLRMSVRAVLFGAGRENIVKNLAHNMKLPGRSSSSQ